MSRQSDTASVRSNGASAEERRRRAYEAPRVLSRELLEAIATVCTPSPPAKADPGSCPSGPLNS